MQDIDIQTRKRTQTERTLTGFSPPYNVAQFIVLQPAADTQRDRLTRYKTN